MAADALQKAISANNIEYGNAIVATGAKKGTTATQTLENGIVYSNIETTLYNVLDRRFDDVTFYTA